MLEDIGSKVEREAGGGDVKEEEEAGGGKAESEVARQDNATARGKEKLGRQNSTDIRKEGGQLDLKDGGGVKKALRSREKAEQSALKSEGKSHEGAAALVLAAALCYHLLL